MLLDNINTQQKKCLDFWLKKLGFEGLIEYLDPNKEILEEFKDGYYISSLLLANLFVSKADLLQNNGKT